LPFDTLAYWAAKSQGSRGSSAARESVTVVPADRLERFGQNLPNAYFSLRNERSADEWDHIMDLVRLGLGHWVESINTRPDGGGGKIALWLKLRNSDLQIPAVALSDGQLAYLGFVALTQLNAQRSLLCFDEPDLHLHPHLMARVLSLFQEVAERHPVILATHSRRLLDELDDPAESVAVCELNPDEFRTTVSRLNADRLGTWLESYDGLGQVLDAGYEASLLSNEPTAGAPQ
jgi:predicted ATPase